MEKLLHYVWKHRLYGSRELLSEDGERVEVIDPGLANSHAGPDFFNAKVKIGDQLWVGNVEIHLRASDWYAHHHERDEAYNGVILHVVATSDRRVQTASGRELPQLVMAIPPQLQADYNELMLTDSYPPCYKAIPRLPRLMVHAWLSTLQVERLERKTADIRERVARCNGNWEQALFVTLARNFGFGINSEAMEQWAQAVELHQVAHHRDDLFQIEAFFLGQAGLLDVESMSERFAADARNDDYFLRMSREYTYLRHKFGLQSIDQNQWRFLRLRPQNFPYIRLSQLARLYFSRRAELSQLVECTSLKALRTALAVEATPYWKLHHRFGAESRRSDKRLSTASIDLLLINTVIPMLFAYGRYRHDEQLCERAMTFLEQLRAEDNHIVRMWKACGLEVDSAADTQALIQLKTVYCDRRDCLRCRFGYIYLKKR